MFQLVVTQPQFRKWEKNKIMIQQSFINKVEWIQGILRSWFIDWNWCRWLKHMIGTIYNLEDVPIISIIKAKSLTEYKYFQCRTQWQINFLRFLTGQGDQLISVEKKTKRTKGLEIRHIRVARLANQVRR